MADVDQPDAAAAAIRRRQGRVAGPQCRARPRDRQAHLRRAGVSAHGLPADDPGAALGRFDAINTGLFWTEERSKMLYLVPYAQQAISIYTDPSSSLKLEKFEDLAGRVVGVESATYTERKAREFSTAMEAKGLKPIELRTFTTVTATSAALRAGQLEAALNINETANSLEQKGIAKIWVRDIAGTDITLAFRDKLLAQAVADALTAIRADGTYDKLFDKFGMTKLKTTTFAIRGDGPTN
ncbi:bll3296 [Bradyrhizobium diazoefficiens USDA 110]|uniref:Bll3296 protein n=1 Tax=Bradyrhizobium diazoefficiens (strain JCM 10833 / BCRC 13528 / IAM 13628 / NBRC 14792 / USDA 110) TaxID=224911 RepID=Q89Q34_BRADU|nr:hypothetical protein Bdiaspc4_17045 [Bradyrhizobium diazoefficiens]BAC48561.1 bll3296 [Bradyrhizobium diazoefficiens USDA 110]